LLTPITSSAVTIFVLMPLSRLMAADGRQFLVTPLAAFPLRFRLLSSGHAILADNGERILPFAA
jgi:hypothetical protein